MGDKQEDIIMDESGDVDVNNNHNDNDVKNVVEKEDEKENSNQTDTTSTEHNDNSNQKDHEELPKEENKNENNNLDDNSSKDVEVINSKKPEYVPPEIMYHYHTLEEMFPNMRMKGTNVEHKKVKRKKRKRSVDNHNNRNLKKSMTIVLSSEVEVDQSTQSKPSKSHLELLSSLQEEHQESDSTSFNNEEKYNMDFFSEMHEDQGKAKNNNNNLLQKAIFEKKYSFSFFIKQ